MDFPIVPRMDAEREVLLTKEVRQLDRILDRPQDWGPVNGSGILERIGSLLWQSSGLDARALLDAIEEAREDEEFVRLIVSGHEYQHLPWELLYHEHPRLGFLGRHPWCVVTRRIRGSGKKVPKAAPRPLRLLLFISSPEDLDPERNRLDFEHEEALLFTALDGPLSRGEIEIDVAEDGFLSTLLDRLERRPYHAVILSMHGAPALNRMDEKEWGLLFEDERTWRSSPVAGSDLAEALDRLPAGHRPGFVVLSACRSAKEEEDTSSSIPSVAAKLHESGFHRVLGMRLSVLDDAASAFSAALFRRLSLGEAVGRAVGLARDEVSRGDWFGGPKDLMRREVLGDPFGQWSLPVLLDRTADGPLVDLSVKGEAMERPSTPSVLIGDGTIHIPSRASFVGRRANTRQNLRLFLEGSTRCLLFTGPGGVGKTALAALYARYLLERYPEIRLLGFRAPFDLKTLYEPLRNQAFDGTEEPELHESIRKETDLRRQVRQMLLSLSRRKRPCAFVLDNLESIQDLTHLRVGSEHEESFWFLLTVCELPPPTRVLLTGRYAFQETEGKNIVHCNVPDAPFGDILCRMNRLQWPGAMGAEEKRWVYQVLGGNHRAIEWAAQLLSDEKGGAIEILKALEQIETPPETPDAAVKTVLEAMRQNLLFSELRNQLSEHEDRLLRALSLYRVPVNGDGLLAVETNPAGHEAARKRLLDYALLESAPNPALEMNYFQVPPVIRQLLDDVRFDPEELKTLHHAMGRHHRFQGRCVSRLWSDVLEAIHHFRLAGDHLTADELAEYACGFYYRIGNFADASRLSQEIVERASPPPPCWALNRYGMCQLTLGSPTTALAVMEHALSLATAKVDVATTLNNISQIYHARGDYKTALHYLKQCLEIQQEVGNKVGEATALNNIGQIYCARGDYDTALHYYKQSLKIKKEVGDKAGEGATLNNISQIYDAQDDYDTALGYLKQCLKITQEIGDKAGEGTALNNIGMIYHDRGDHESALGYLKQSLDIQQEIGDRKGEAITLGNIGENYHDLGDYDTAFHYYKQSLKIKKEIGDRKGEATTLNNIGMIYHDRGDHESALGYLKQSLKIQQEIGDKAGMISTLHNMGKMFYMLDQKEEAKKHLEVAVQLGRAIEHPQVQQVEKTLKELGL